MVKTIDLTSDLDGLIKLEGRGPNTTEEEAQASFMTLSDFRDGGLYAAHFSGSSGWKKHPKGDEIVQILEGETLLEIIVNDKIETHYLKSGSLLVVPRDCWHRFTSDKGVKVWTATPRPTQHLHVDDPRKIVS